MHRFKPKREEKTRGSLQSLKARGFMFSIYFVWVLIIIWFLRINTFIDNYINVIDDAQSQWGWKENMAQFFFWLSIDSNHKKLKNEHNLSHRFKISKFQKH